jgi:hypothetical protein
MCFFSFVAFISLYTTLVCIGCSQLEKLRASLLAIKQTRNTPEEELGAEADQKEEKEEKPHTSEDVFRQMQAQLNDCIRQHQNTLEYGCYSDITING